MTVETIRYSEQIRIRIERDTDADSPANWGHLGEIAYCSRRETLGTENVSRPRLDEISEGLRSGALIGLPVYALVHGGVTISTRPFSCPWDSGQSGFIYCTKGQAIAEFGKKVATKAVIEKTLQCLRSEVVTFDQYLQGDVYGYIIETVSTDEDGEETYEEVSSCWGLYGQDYCKCEAEDAAEYHTKEMEKEGLERGYWGARDVMTVA